MASKRVKKRLRNKKGQNIWLFLFVGGLSTLFLAVAIVVGIEKINQNNMAAPSTDIVDVSDDNKAVEDNLIETKSMTNNESSDSFLNSHEFGNTNTVQRNNDSSAVNHGGASQSPNNEAVGTTSPNDSVDQAQQSAETPADQTVEQDVPVESIRISYGSSNQRFYGDDELDLTLIVLPENATYNSSEIKWSILNNGGDNRCAKMVGDKVHITAKYCTQSPFIHVSLRDKYNERAIPIEPVFSITQYYTNSLSEPCGEIRQYSTCTYKAGERVGFGINADSVIWTVSDYDRGGAVPEFSVYAKYSDVADGVGGSISKIEVKSMYSSQVFTFYIKIK